MSVNEEPVDIATDSFWEIGQYRRSVKRCDDGFELCSRLALLVHERAEIEKLYSSNLKKWSQKWRAFLDKGPEYGTTKCAWGGVAEEADALSEIHAEMRTKLMDTVQIDVKNWQKEHYHKTTLPPQRLKESKDFEDKFQRAQKQWARQYKSVMDCKKAYHSACKQDKSLKLQLQNAKNDPSAQSEQVRKLEDKVKKAERDVERTETAYKNALTDLDNFNPSYMRNMSEVFAECQAFEQLRLAYFKEALSRYHRAVDISSDERLPIIYSNLYSTIQKADAHQDLRWWSQHNGEDMPMQWPKFEEYVPELKQTINKSMKSGSSLATDEGVRLHAISSSHGGSVRGGGGSVLNQGDQPAAAGEDGGAASPPQAAERYRHSTTLPKRAQLPASPAPADEERQQAATHKQTPAAAAPPATAAAVQNLDSEDPLFDDGRPGVKVKALYDYECTDDDELSFKKDEVFEKLDEEDEQGWCKGRKDGRVGLYPANYAVPV